MKAGEDMGVGTNQYIWTDRVHDLVFSLCKNTRCMIYSVVYFCFHYNKISGFRFGLITTWLNYFVTGIKG